MLNKIKAYADLLRLHFLPAWPAIFCGGLFLGFFLHGGFSPELVIKAVLIAAFGFEAGFILNDLIDAEPDKKDVEGNLTAYFRPFHTRPLAGGAVSVRSAWVLFWLCFFVTLGLTLSLPYPHSLYVMLIGFYSLPAEAFYQLKKRRQSFPWSQLIGRTDFALFPVAGYLCAARPDWTALLIFLFFYPLAEAHLGLNDLIDEKNDRARGMKAIAVLYGTNGGKAWFAGFSALHLMIAGALLYFFPAVVPAWFLLGFALIVLANFIALQEWWPIPKLAALPLVHLTMFVYALSLIIFSVQAGPANFPPDSSRIRSEVKMIKTVEIIVANENGQPIRRQKAGSCAFFADYSFKITGEPELKTKLAAAIKRARQKESLLLRTEEQKGDALVMSGDYLKPGDKNYLHALIIEAARRLNEASPGKFYSLE